VFECPCGSQHFYLHQDGCIECPGCHLIIEKIEWIYRDMKAPA
jgi:ferredoxin-like protein FixX